jgi:Ca2+:H+ antiporter
MRKFFSPCSEKGGKKERRHTKKYAEFRCLDKIRSYARRSAWYDDDGESNRNPFKKTRVNRLRPTSTTRQLEDGILHRSTDGTIQSSTELRRLKDLSHGLQTGERADTWPTTSAPVPSSSQTQEGSIQEKHILEPAGSQDPINISRSIDGDNTEDGTARRRKPTTTSLSETTRTKSVDSGKSAKPVFTVASQLRATILNSWINVLFICVPVGSMFFVPNCKVNYILTTRSCSQLYKREQNGRFRC